MSSAVAGVLDKDNQAAVSDLVDLFGALTRANARLLDTNQRLILAIDEYENIDEKIGSQTFPMDLLAALRKINAKLTAKSSGFLLAATISRNWFSPTWTSYLVSARTIEMPLFAPEETRLLPTQPLTYSPLWKRDDEKRPHFSAGFWGPGGIERITMMRRAGGRFRCSCSPRRRSTC